MKGYTVPRSGLWMQGEYKEFEYTGILRFDILLVKKGDTSVKELLEEKLEHVLSFT